MIIKKPYAFIIKYFKYIHIGLCLLLSFICIKFFLLLRFFNDYVGNGYYTYYESLNNHFIGIYTYIIIFIIIVFSVLLYLVMKVKNKNTKYYFSLIIFYIIIFIFLFFIANILSTLQIESIDIRDIRVFRDLLIIASFPQIFFTGFALFRSLGFDIKSFDFKKDLEELNIKEEDSEVIEVLIPNDSYKYMRKFRRFLRETKYFILEYKFIIYLVLGISILVIFITLYLNINVYNKKYKETDEFSNNEIKYTILESYLTSIDYGGEKIKDGYSYVVVKIKVENITNKQMKLETDNLKLMFEDKYILPILSKNNYFIDLGQGYSNQYLNSNEAKEYLIIYEIKNNYRKSNYILRIYSNVLIEDGKFNIENKDVKIYPLNVDDLNIADSVNLKEKIMLGESNLKKSNVTFNFYEISDSFEQEFNYEVNYKKYKGIKRFVPNIIGSKKKTIIKIECNYKYDENLYISKEVKSCTDLISHFGSIYYDLGDIAKISNINILTSDFINKDKVFVEAPYEIKNAKKISLYLNIRNIRYIIILK